MSITNQLPRIATEEDCKQPWSEGKNGIYFRCSLCGHKFIPGDRYRLVLMKHYTNVLICKVCDGTNEEVNLKWQKAHEDWEKMKESSPFWSFIKDLEIAERDASHEAAEASRENSRLVREIREDLDTFHARRGAYL